MKKSEQGAQEGRGESHSVPQPGRYRYVRKERQSKSEEYDINTQSSY